MTSVQQFQVKIPEKDDSNEHTNTHSLQFCCCVNCNSAFSLVTTQAIQVYKMDIFAGEEMQQIELSILNSIHKNLSFLQSSFYLCNLDPFGFKFDYGVTLKLMLEDSSFPITKKLMSDRFSLMENTNLKRKPEDGDEVGNSLKLLKNNRTGEMEVDFLNLSLSLAVIPSDNVENAGDGSGTSSLIPQIGEDNSINCIARCSLSLALIPSDNVENAGDGSDTSSLIPLIGEDNSRNCIARCSRSDYGSIAQLNSSFRSLVNGKELYMLRRQLGIVEHWIYFACNLREWEVFDPIRLRWKHLPIMPSNDCFTRSDKESLAVGTELLVFGKEITAHLIFKYSLLTNSWSTGVEMNTPRCLFGSAALGEKAIVAGGCDVWGNMFSCAELYNSDTGTWETLPSMNKARKKCSAVFMDGKFYVVGGQGVQNSPLTCGEVYDLERQTWTEIPDMLPLRNAEPGAPDAPSLSAAPPLLTVVNNELYAADYALKEVRKYNKGSNSWATLGSLPETAVSMNGWGLAFRGCGDKLIVLGGPRLSDGGFVEVNSWVPSESPQQWTVLGRKRSGGFVYNCAIMGC